MPDSTFIQRVVLKNYRSIASCDVPLGPLSFLVGPNGSGKSNFLDALRFVADSLNGTLDHALRDRGGFDEVRHQPGSGRPTTLLVHLELALPDGYQGQYAIRISPRAKGQYSLRGEGLFLHRPNSPNIEYEVGAGKLTTSNIVSPPAVSGDRLYLVNVSGLPEFRPVYDALSHMGFYNLNSDSIRDLQARSALEILAHDGSNLTGILDRLEKDHPATKRRIEEYLSKVVPGIAQVAVKPVGTKETIEFLQASPPGKRWRFPAANMSDGTLRALGNLVALFQFTNGDARRGSLVGIEEPETALHPAAAGVLRDALREASQTTQVIVTSHSPDLLDDASIPENQILAVATEDGATRIGPIDEAGRSSLRDRLFTAGELLRLDQLQPAPQQDAAGAETE